MPVMAALRLLTVCAPLAQGLSFNSMPLAPAQREASGAVEHAMSLSANVTKYLDALAEASSGRPTLVPPGDVRLARRRHSASKHASLLGISDNAVDLRGSDHFQPSEEFRASGELGQGSDLPWGISSPRTGDSLPVFEESSMPILDHPKWVEYSLETGDNIQSFSTASQDVQLITQVLENITNGFFLDTNGGDGEVGSNTLLLELTGWRGIITEPRVYPFATLLGKFRKAWLFLGCVSPNGNATKIGFDVEGLVDMESGHQIHAYPVKTFLEEMGGRKTIDFWALNNGGYEMEVLNETLLHSGSDLEIGVIMVTFEGRVTGRGYQDYVQHRSKDLTEELIYEVMHNASYTYVGGLDPYWINYVMPRYHFRDHVWVYPPYFERRGLPVPTSIKSKRPPPLEYPRQDQAWQGRGQPGPPWDERYSSEQEVGKMIAYIGRARAAAAAAEDAPKAHRTNATKIWEDPSTLWKYALTPSSWT